MQQFKKLFVGSVALVCFCAAVLSAQSTKPDKQPSSKKGSSDAKVGLDLILNHPFLPRDFHQSTLEEVWKDWPDDLKSKAEKLDAAGRRKMIFERYGLTARKDDPRKAVQFTVDAEGWWAMNCFACHGGKVAGKPILGVPNSHIALSTLYGDMRKTKMRLGKKMNQMDLGSVAIPMGTSNGTSNAVVFGIALMSFRDKDLNLTRGKLRPFIIHHDMDAPAWWNVKKRPRLYIDGFVQKNHRALVPFVMDKRNSGDKMRSWEEKFKKVFAYINSLEAPRYPFEIDDRLASQGKEVFNDNCSSCHGTYGKTPTYPSRVVPLSKVGTDPIRLKALTEYDRKVYKESWFAHYGKDDTTIKPKGYLAPPLDGLWASAPYFHNGSVPTLWHVLNPKERPKLWKRTVDGYDKKKVGLEVEVFESLPKSVKRRGDLKRMYFQTTRRGKSAAGHPFADNLNKDQKRQLLEYLKTL